MKTNSRRVTREELFNLVWQRPISAVAPELGMSDVRLSELCRRTRIPTPRWDIVPGSVTGKRVAALFPPAPTGQSENVAIEARSPGRNEFEAELPPNVAARVVLELAEMEPINVPEVADPHPIIAPLRSGRGSDKPSSKCPAIRQRPV